MKRSKIIKFGLTALPLILFLCLWLLNRFTVKEYVGSFDVSSGGWTKAEPAALSRLSSILQAHPSARRITVNYHIALGPQVQLPARLEYSPSSEVLKFYTESHKVITCTQVTSNIIHDAASKHRTMDVILYPNLVGGSGYGCKCDNYR